MRRLLLLMVTILVITAVAVMPKGMAQTSGPLDVTLLSVSCSTEPPHPFFATQRVFNNSLQTVRYTLEYRLTGGGTFAVTTGSVAGQETQVFDTSFSLSPVPDPGTMVTAFLFNGDTGESWGQTNSVPFPDCGSPTTTSTIPPTTTTLPQQAACPDCQEITADLHCQSVRTQTPDKYVSNAMKESNVQCFRVRREESGNWYVVSACSRNQQVISRIFK